MKATRQIQIAAVLLGCLFTSLESTPAHTQSAANETWTANTSAGGNGVTVADLDGDGKAEVIYAGRVAGYGSKSCIAVLEGGTQGTLRPGWPQCYSGGVDFGAAPTVADIGRGGLSVIAVSGGTVNAVQGVYAWDKDGNLLFQHLFDPMNPCNGCTPSTYDDDWNTKQPQPRSYVFYPNASPTVADVTGTGPSIIVTIPAANDNGDYYGFVLVLDPNGKDRPGFPFFVSQAIFGAAAVGDVDGDGKNEIVIGTDAERMLVIKGNGRPLTPFGMHNSAPGSSYEMHPTVADLSGSGMVNPMIMTWLKPDVPTAQDPAGRPGLHVFDRFGRRMGGTTLEWLYPHEYPWSDGEGNLLIDGAHTWPDLAWVPQSSPVSVDIDGDGVPETFVAGWDGKLHYLRWNGVQFIEAGQFVPPGGPSMRLMMSEPVIADVDGNGAPEIVIGAYDASDKWPNGSGGIYAWHLDGSMVSGFPISVGYGVKAPLAVGDTNGDGRLDLVAIDTTGVIHNIPTAGRTSATLWSQHHHDAAHTGRGWNWAENHAPKQPSIRATASGIGYNALSWDVADRSGVTAYSIYRCLPGEANHTCAWNSEFSLLDRVDASYQAYVDRTVTGMQPYVYRVASRSGSTDVWPWSAPRSPYATPMHLDGPVSAISAAPMEQNLISNGGFEIASPTVANRLSNDTENVFQDWDRIPDANYTPNWDRPKQVTDAHGGRYAMKLHSISGAGYLDMFQPLRYGLNSPNSNPVIPDAGIPLHPNATYELGFWVKVTNGSADVLIALSDTTAPGYNLKYYTPPDCSTSATYKYCSKRFTSNSNSVFLTVWVRSSTPGTDVYIDDVQLKDTTVLTPVALRSGWNLVGLPGILTGTSVSPGLQSIASQYSNISTLQANCTAGPAHSWQVTPPQNTNSLSTLNGTQGYWLSMTQSGLLFLVSRDATLRDPGATVCPGWNLLAYPGTAARNLGIAGTLPSGVTEVWSYNNNTWQRWRANMPGYVNTLTTLQPGVAYWIRNDGPPVTWSLP